jgi:uncharacterized membrane protein YcaP (DUF421 family)
MGIEWNELLEPSMSLLELVLRGSAMYLILFLVLRVLVRRHVGSMSLMDLLLMVLIADAAQNAMSKQYQSITEGLVLCGTLIGWNYLLDVLAYRFPRLGRWLEPPPLPIVRSGRLQRRNMRHELLTEDEVLSQLRQQGIVDLETVKIAFVEPDGGISVIKYGPRSASEQKGSKRRKKGSGLT